jgi:hypothetical protein
LNPYTLLGLSPSASPDDIRAAYRRLAAEWHPDLQPPERKAEALERMVQLNAARDVLLDPHQRAQFHRQYNEALRWRTAQSEAPRPRRSSAFMYEINRRRRRQWFYQQLALTTVVLGVLFFISMLGLMVLAGDTPEMQFQMRAMWTGLKALLVLGGSMVGTLVFAGLLMLIFFGMGSVFRR